MKSNVSSVMVIMLVVLSSACSSAQAPTDTPPPTVTSSSAAESTSESTQSPTATVANSIDVKAHGLSVNESGETAVDEVTSATPGWLCIHADQDGQPGPLLGCSAVPAGETHDLSVSLDLTKLHWKLHTVLYVDAGTPGKMEVPDPDIAALSATGVPISFPETLSGDLSWITVEEQMPGEGNTVVIPHVYTPIPALLVIHDGERSPFVIGWAALQAGENDDVIVTLSSQSKTNDLGAMLHWDGGEPGYQSFLLDPEARTQTGDILVVQFPLK